MKKVLVIVTVIVIIALFASYKCSRSRGVENVETSPETSQTETAPAVEEAPAQNEEPSEEVKEEPAPAQKEEPAAAPAQEPKKEVRKAKPAAEKAEKVEKTEKPATEKEAPKARPVEKKPLEREEKAAPDRPMPEVKRAPDDANIDSAGVMKVISVSRAAIKRCYDKALISNPQLKGKMSIKIVINQQGRVDKTEIVDDTLHDAEVAKCVKGVVGRLRFPKPADGTATVTFPFAFDPKNQ
ncbi:AgmX/PglI C-terminal domain-containing protein [bacterium]|nr:AgmX/PglI C-terminal domain-containing protein [bacterium]